ncbi:uncharacterized protein LOC132257786 [Phlebotomus argentipes]|uniref:uncharacterized protein LOC132257786 n=1 Tax=Phlebotomus argentipes TaxID=94469 RepID=UPI00289313AB|nr:uncharacterized protein LOC132257786 [Phlebotomus argentipes]
MGKLLSNTWSFFKKIDEKTAQCNLCLKVVKTSGNTTNARNHLKIKHKLLEQETRPISIKIDIDDKSDKTRYIKDEQSQEDIEILEQVEEVQIEEQMPQDEQCAEDKEESSEVYCLEVLEEEDSAYENLRPVESKGRSSGYVAKRLLNDGKRGRRESGESVSKMPKYDFSSAVDIFFASMAATVKQMPPDKIILMKQKISEIVFQEEMAQLMNEDYE